MPLTKATRFVQPNSASIGAVVRIVDFFRIVEFRRGIWLGWTTCDIVITVERKPKSGMIGSIDVTYDQLW